MTVKDLMEFIHDNRVPRDAKIIYQRIEDEYFDGVDISGLGGIEADGAINGIFPPGSKATPWNTVKIKGLAYYHAVRFNEKIEKGKLVIEGKYDKDSVGEFFWKDEFKDKRSPYDLTNDAIFDQYVDVNTIYYNKENNAVCITAHS